MKLKKQYIKSLRDSLDIEVGYYIGFSHILTAEIADLIEEVINIDGISIFGLFCEFIVKQFDLGDYTEIYNYIDCEAERLFKEFKEEYFEEKIRE